MRAVLVTQPLRVYTRIVASKRRYPAGHLAPSKSIESVPERHLFKVIHTVCTPSVPFPLLQLHVPAKDIPLLLTGRSPGKSIVSVLEGATRELEQRGRQAAYETDISWIIGRAKQSRAGTRGPVSQHRRHCHARRSCAETDNLAAVTYRTLSSAKSHTGRYSVHTRRSAGPRLAAAAHRRLGACRQPYPVQRSVGSSESYAIASLASAARRLGAVFRVAYWRAIPLNRRSRAVLGR